PSPRLVRGILPLMFLMALGRAAQAQQPPDPLDKVPGLDALPSPPIAFIAIPPCRLADTRPSGGFTGPFGPPALIGGAIRVFPMAGFCGIPTTAQVVSANITVTFTTGPGFISLWPAGDPQPAPLTSSLNYFASDTKANAVLVPLGTSGGVTGTTVYS